MQPKPKRKSLYDDLDIDQFISVELFELIDEAIDGRGMDYPKIKEFTPFYFLLHALNKTGSMLYTALNTFMTRSSIEEMYKNLEKKITEEIEVVDTPNSNFFFSKEMMHFLNEADSVRQMVKSEFITSDHVLFAMVDAKIYTEVDDFLRPYGVNVDKMYKAINGLYSIVNTFNKKSQKSNIPKKTPTTIQIIGSAKNLSNFSLSEDGFSFGENKNKFDLNKYTTDLVKNAYKYTPTIGRDDVIEQITYTFNRRDVANVVLVGEHGVGKTKIIEGICKQVYDKSSSVTYKDKQIISLNINNIVAGTTLRGMAEERCAQIYDELSTDERKYLVVIEDIHMHLGKKNNDDNAGIDSLINDILSNNNIPTIITTTPKGFKKVFESTNINNKFRKFIIEEPSVEETINILKGVKETYEKHHSFKYDNDIIEGIVKLSKRYITDKYLPSSAMEILDTVGAKKNIILYDNKETRNKYHELSLLNKKLDVAKKTNAPGIDEIRQHINDLFNEITTDAENISDDEKQIKIEDVYDAISNETGIPVGKINISEKASVAKIDSVLKEHIIGQDEAMDVIAKSIKRSKVGLYPSNRPIASFFFNGPSGCGKTISAKTLAREIFGDDKYLIRFDMSEYSDKTAVNKLIGSSAGYVGYDRGGLLTEAVKNKKHCVLLIDEIEKANEEIYNLFLQVLDEGFLTDNVGQKVDFKNTVIIFTSNVGAKKAMAQNTMGFVPNTEDSRKEIILKELKQKFPPEFINRLDDIIYFNRLSDENLKVITKIELNKLNERIKEHNFSISFDNEVLEYIVSKINEKDKDYGARPIIRLIQTEIENKLTDILLENDYTEYNFNITIENNNVNIR